METDCRQGCCTRLRTAAWLLLQESSDMLKIVPVYLDYCNFEKKKKEKKIIRISGKRPDSFPCFPRRKSVAAHSRQAPGGPLGLQFMEPKTPTAHLMLRFKGCGELDQSKTIRGLCSAQAPVFEAVQRTQLSCNETHQKPWDTLAANQSLVHPNNVWVSL